MVWGDKGFPGNFGLSSALRRANHSLLCQRMILEPGRRIDESSLKEINSKPDLLGFSSRAIPKVCCTLITTYDMEYDKREIMEERRK